MNKAAALATLAISAALAVLLLGIAGADRLLFAVLFWSLPVLGMGMLALTLFRARNWRLLGLLPIFLLPLSGGAMLLYARGTSGGV